MRIPKNMLHLDELFDGTWRMTFTSSLLPAPEVLQGISLAISGRKGAARLEYDGFPALEMPISRVAPIAPPGVPNGEPTVPHILHLD